MEKMQNVVRHCPLRLIEEPKKISISLAFEAFGKAIPVARDKQSECDCVFTQLLVLKYTSVLKVALRTGGQAVPAMGEEKIFSTWFTDLQWNG